MVFRAAEAAHDIRRDRFWCVSAHPERTSNVLFRSGVEILRFITDVLHMFLCNPLCIYISSYSFTGSPGVGMNSSRELYALPVMPARHGQAKPCRRSPSTVRRSAARGRSFVVYRGGRPQISVPVMRGPGGPGFSGATTIRLLEGNLFWWYAYRRKSVETNAGGSTKRRRR